MPTTSTSPNMGIIVPIPMQELGPQWATDLFNALFTTLDQHDHSAGKGLQIRPAGLNINADLPFGSNNATALRSSRYTSQGAPIAGGTDLGCLYNVLGDAYWNNAAGAQIQLTKNGAVNATQLVFPLHPGTGGGTILATDPYVWYYLDVSGGTATINLPAASALTPGRIYFFVDIKAASGTNLINIVPNGADKINGVNATYSIGSNGATAMLTADGVGNWYASTDPPVLPMSISLTGVTWTGGGTPTYSQFSTLNATGANWTIQSQASTNGNGTPGNIILNTPAPTGSGNVGFTVFESGSVPVGGIGAWNNSSANGALWLGGAPVPGFTTGMALLQNASGLQVNAPSGQALFLEIAATPYLMFTNLGGVQCTFFNSGTAINGGGQTVIGIANATVIPTGAISGGGVLYENSGAATHYGSGKFTDEMGAAGSGTINTQLASARRPVQFGRTTTSGGTITFDTAVPTGGSSLYRIVAEGKVATGSATGTVGDTVGWTREACFKNVSGTVTQVGATTTVSTFADTNMATGSGIALSVSSTNMRATITAPTAEGATPTIDWTYQVIFLNN